MASGKKNYFRHSTSAFDDPKIQALVNEYGLKGYAYYFILLELCARQCENEFRGEITFHIRTILSQLRKTPSGVSELLSTMSRLDLLQYSISDSLVKIKIPKLAKYMGKYETKLTSNSPNKRKEKEIKEKEIKIKENKINTSANSEQSTSDVREAYKNSYYLRYGIYPVWSVKENYLVKKLVASVGLDEAKRLAEFYPSYRDRFHEQKKHPFGLLVSQLDQVRVSSMGRISQADYGNPYTRQLREMDRLEKLNEVKNEQG